MRSFAVGIVRLEFVVEEIAHDKVVEMVLVRVVALVEDDQSDVLHTDEPMHQKVVELLRHRYKHVVRHELSLPRFQF